MANQTVYHLTYPSANLYLAKKWDIAKHEKHLNKLKEMRPAIDMEAPVGFGTSDRDILERARKEVKRVSKEQEAKNYILEGNLKIVKKIAAIKLDTHRQWLLRESIVKKSPFNPFLEKRLKEQKRIQVDNNKMVLKVETQKSGLEYQKVALLRYYERNKNVGRKLGDFKHVELHQKDIIVRVNEQVVVPRSTEKCAPITSIVKKRVVRIAGKVGKVVVKSAEKSVKVAAPVSAVQDPVPIERKASLAKVQFERKVSQAPLAAAVVQEAQPEVVVASIKAVSVESVKVAAAPEVVEEVQVEAAVVEVSRVEVPVAVKAVSVEELPVAEVLPERAASVVSVHAVEEAPIVVEQVESQPEVSEEAQEEAPVVQETDTTQEQE